MTKAFLWKSALPRWTAPANKISPSFNSGCEALINTDIHETHFTVVLSHENNLNPITQPSLFFLLSLPHYQALRRKWRKIWDGISLNQKLKWGSHPQSSLSRMRGTRNNRDGPSSNCLLTDMMWATYGRKWLHTNEYGNDGRGEGRNESEQGERDGEVCIKEKGSQRNVCLVTSSTTLGYASGTVYVFNEKCITLGVS